MLLLLYIGNMKYALLRQLVVSLALPEHGVLPPLELLVRVHVASMLHVPEQVPQALQVAHIPSTDKTTNMILFIYLVYFNYPLAKHTCTAASFTCASRAWCVASTEASYSSPSCINITCP